MPRLPWERTIKEVRYRQDQGRWKLSWGLDTLTLDARRRPVTASWQGQIYLRGLEGQASAQFLHGLDQGFAGLSSLGTAFDQG